VVKELKPADTIRTLELLRERPVLNVFLEYVVRSGAIGRIDGFYGYESAEKLLGVMLIGPLGGTAVEIRDAAAAGPLAEHAAGLRVRPRHIVGPEDATTLFFQSYESQGAPVRWTRREPVYLVDSPEAARAHGRIDKLRQADPYDLEEIVQNSAQQHIDDLDDDRFAADPAGFRIRHQTDIQQQRWWVLREGGRIVFQVHVGAENREAVQIGGVFTPPDLRGQGIATRGVAAVVLRLLSRRPAVMLFCGEDNGAARRVYEKVGFGVISNFRSWLLEEPLT